MSEEELLSVREVARICGKSEETVRRWIWSGKLRATKLGNQLFVSRADIPGHEPLRVGEAVATYETDSMKAGAKALRLKRGYSRMRALEALSRAKAFSRELADRGVSVDVVEALREARESR